MVTKLSKMGGKKKIVATNCQNCRGELRKKKINRNFFLPKIGEKYIYYGNQVGKIVGEN